ncbi:MAG: hypothetical protein HQM03_11180 [Magnetococcales bacterium]|nr:hypothetical protein [Magnetococcales bacterium]
MDAVIRKHHIFLLSSIYMLVGLCAAGYSVWYGDRQVLIKDLNKARSELETHKTEIAKTQKRITDDAEKAKGGVNSLPVFLARINEIANKNKVIIRTLSPDGEQQFKFMLEMTADYFTFVRFTSDLEALDILLDDLQVHSYDMGQTPPLHAISFSLIPRNDASPLSENARLSALQSWIEQKGRRNPFQRFAYDVSRKQVRPVIDLTWIYKLGGLGITPEGKRYATIDHKDYHVGYKLEERTITAIESDRVLFEKQTPDGKVTYSLEFRRGEANKKK